LELIAVKKKSQFHVTSIFQKLCLEYWKQK